MCNKTAEEADPIEDPLSPLLEQEDNMDGPPRICLRGLQNLGNMCYLNSSLQMLYTCQNMISAIGKLPGGHLTKSVIEIGEELHQRSSCSDNVPAAVNPRNVKEAIDGKTDKFTGYEQRDAHEFLNDLINYMHEELEEQCDDEGEKVWLPTNNLCLCIQVCLKCNSCGYTQ
jgi:ubiquitin C-terminal hydrolase